jgi:hypothetical protein
MQQVVVEVLIHMELVVEVDQLLEMADIMVVDLLL